MKLPKIETPTFELKQPSSKKILKYRPFLVKEEKILLIANESKDPKAIYNAMKEVVEACTFEKIKVDDITPYDLEYIFLKLRSKSVGETSTIKIKCPECGEYNSVDVNLEKVEVVYPTEKVEPKIQLTDKVGITLKHLTVGDVASISPEEGQSESIAITKAICKAIDTIFDETTVHSAKDASEAELIEFVESLNRNQIEKINAFLQATPKIEYLAKFKCTKCGKNVEVKLEGTQSFF
jgi:transposase-like protein